MPIHNKLPWRIGYGYDIHAFVDASSTKKLILAGHTISHLGLKALSDGDIVWHALADAILGAVSLHDIGFYFPKVDDSGLIIRHAIELCIKAGYQPRQTDITLLTKTPKMSQYRDTIRQSVASVLDTDIDCVSFKAKTNNHQDAIGEGKAMGAHVVVLVEAIAL